MFVFVMVVAVGRRGFGVLLVVVVVAAAVVVVVVVIFVGFVFAVV